MILREIEVFHTVMRTGSASKAARLLNVSQPAVSQSLRKLEAYAGIALFQRLRGKLHPTQEAAALFAEVNRCYVGLDAIEHRIRSLRQFGVGRIRLACLPGLGMGFVPRVLKEMSLQERKMTVSLQILGSRQVRERLLASESDIGLMADEVALTGLEHSPFATYEGVVALPVGHPLAAQKVVHPRELVRYPMIALNPEDSASQRLDGVFREHGVRPEILVETPYTFSICELVRQGLGVGVVNAVTACDYVGRDLVLRKFSEHVEYTSILAMPPGQPLTSFAQQLLAAMRTRLHADLTALRAGLE